MMRGMRILMVQNEVVGIDLANHFRSLGAEVLGPVASLKQAAKLVGSADGALLDVDFNSDAVFRFADTLAARDIPFVFFSGTDRVALPERFRFALPLPKPADLGAPAIMPGNRSTRAAASEASNVVQMLPKLRLAARLQLGDAHAADRLVERTLRAAIDDASPARHELSLAVWLNQLMERVLVEERGLMLN
jgi:hypothetical protein